MQSNINCEFVEKAWSIQGMITKTLTTNLNIEIFTVSRDSKAQPWNWWDSKLLQTGNLSFCSRRELPFHYPTFTFKVETLVRLSITSFLTKL